MAYDKNFDKWGEEKKKIHKKESSKVYPKEREIWFMKMGVNIGFEEDGKEKFLRPVLIIKKFGNLFFTVALTSKGKDNHYFYHKIKTAQFNEQNQKHKNSSYVILSQGKTIDKKRFTENMGFVSKEEFAQIKEKLRTVLI